MVARGNIKPALEMLDFVVFEGFYQFFKDLHHRIPALVAVFEVLEAHSKNQGHITIIQLTQYFEPT